jgi:aliphatic nitrilase
MIMIHYPAYKVAAAHVAPVFLDTDRSVDKACSVIEEAAGHGARLIAFPEAFLPGFPVWAALGAPIRTHELFKALAASAVEIDGPELARLRETARRKGIFVSIGFTEGTKASVGCLWNSNALIGADGTLLNHHRKLVPTYYEKLIWANGDGRGLRVCGTELGRIGMLICGENTNPLARFALMAEGEQVHISSYPPVWPTRPPGVPGNYDLAQAICIRAGAHAFEAKVFNLVASSCVDHTLRHAIEGALGREPLRILERSPGGISVVLDPTGTPVGDSLCRDEGILYADIDLAQSVEPKQFHDVVGYYNRFDIFALTVNRSARRPATFVDEVHPVVSGREPSPGQHAHHLPVQNQRIPSGCGDVLPGQSVVLKPTAPARFRGLDFGTDDGTLFRALAAVFRLLSRGFRRWAIPGPPPPSPTSTVMSSELSV